MASHQAGWKIIVLLAFLGLAGCGEGINFAEVEGIVTVAGQPMDQIQVEFVPQGEGLPSVGITDQAGRFSLTTNDGLRKGAVVGSHKVVLRDAAVMGTQFLGRAGENVDLSQGRKSRIAVDYADAQRTSITKQVTAGKKNEIAIEANPAAK